MSRKVFTAGEVLAAADVNSFLMDQTVMSFAGTAARGSAIPSPVTGMTTYLEDSKDLQIYDGSAYSSPFGLTLVKKQAVGTGVFNVTVTDAFNANYDAYKIIYANGSATNDTFMTMRLGASATQYYQTRIGYAYDGTNNIGWDNGTSQWTVMARINPDHVNCNFELIHPFLTKYTMANNAGDVGSTAAGHISGIHKVAASYTAFSLFANAGTITGGTIYVYGYRKN